mgnify:CR=1 FL=1
MQEFHNGHRIWLPGRRIDDLVCADALMRIESAPHYCRGSRCPHSSHRARVTHGVTFFNDQRPDSPWDAHYEGSTWVTFWTTKLHTDLLAAWQEANGETTGEYALVMLEAIRRPDGRTLLIGHAANEFFTSWLTSEGPKEAP